MHSPYTGDAGMLDKRNKNLQYRNIPLDVKCSY